jgi:hypothetical protein
MTNEDFNKIYTANLNALKALGKSDLSQEDRKKALFDIAKYESLLAEIINASTGAMQSIVMEARKALEEKK